MDATLTPFTVVTAGDRRRDFDPILGRELDWLWPRSNESRTPASVRTNQRLGLKGSSKAPVVTSQELEEARPPGLERGLRKLRRRALPVDFRHNHQVAGINIDALRPSQERQVPPLDVGLQSMARDLGNPFDTVKGPPPALVGMEAQVVEAPMNRVRGSMQVAGKLDTRNQPHAFAQVPVFQFAPGLLTPADFDARCCPGLAKRVEVAKDGVERWIRPPATRTTATATAPPGEPVPVFG